MGIYKKHRTDVAEAPAVVAYPATTHLIRKYVNLSFWKRTVESGHSAKGRMHCATFCRIRPAEKGHPNGLRKVDERAKPHMWNDFQPNLPMDPGENPRKRLS